MRFHTRLPLLFCTESDKKPAGRDLGTRLPCLCMATMPIFSYHVYICTALTSPWRIAIQITTHQPQYQYSNIDTAKRYHCSSALQSVLYNLLPKTQFDNKQPSTSQGYINMYMLLTETDNWNHIS